MRSKLFVPGSRSDLFGKALCSGSDAVCFDLEDAVASDQKESARRCLRAFLEDRIAEGPRLLVRTNAIPSAAFPLDLEAAVWPAIWAIALPKVESADDVRVAEEMLAATEAKRGITSPLGILPTIESPRGLRLAREIAEASVRVIGLQLGFADLLEPLGIASGNSSARNQVRLALRLAAAEAEVDCYDSAFPDFRDLDGYARHLKAARDYGFAGASCIHPSQIAPTNLNFTPTDDEVAYATRVVAAADEAARLGFGVTTVDGKMIDRPFVLAAKRLLARSSLHP